MPARMILRVERHLTTKELEGRIKEEQGPRMLRRLICIRNLYSGDSVREAASDLSLTTGAPQLADFLLNRSFPP